MENGMRYAEGMPRPRHPRNCDGPFYVANGECMACGAPESEAEGLMGHDEGGHCFFIRQPENEEETWAAIRAAAASCCGAVRYAGDNSLVLLRLRHVRSETQCDETPPEDDWKPRRCCSFDYAAPTSGAESLAQTAAWISALMGAGYKRSPVQSDGGGAWFQLSWADRTADFTVQHQPPSTWKVRISGKDLTPWQAMRLDQGLRTVDGVGEIRWFEDTGWPELSGNGDARPH